jgi:hypothetical protein
VLAFVSESWTIRKTDGKKMSESIMKYVIIAGSVCTLHNKQGQYCLYVYAGEALQLKGDRGRDSDRHISFLGLTITN